MHVSKKGDGLFSNKFIRVLIDAFMAECIPLKLRELDIFCIEAKKVGLTS